jgi:prepilin-type N-terminal cleavage/methylation domain-containing protein
MKGLLKAKQGWRVQGFTLVELLLVMGLTAVLMSLITISLLRPQTKANTDAAVSLLRTDLRQQQVKAMRGVKESAAPANFGIYVEPHQYTLFQGTTYQAGAATNVTVPFQTNTTLSTTFSGSQVIFTKVSGEVQNFTPGSNTITVATTNGETVVITVNRYGIPL